MTVIRNNSISGINSITAQSNSLQFYDSAGNTLSIGASVSGNITGDVTGNLTGNVTVATGATISGSTNTIVASTNGSERVRIDSNGHIGIANSSPTSWGTGIPTIEIKGTVSSGGQSTRSGAIAFESGSGSNGYALLWGQEGGIHIYTGATDRASATYRAKFDSTGNLAFASGNGIDFSATSDGSGTTTSELLDDYEEGTWTPTLGNFTGTYTTQSGIYTKIGNIVTLNVHINVATNTGTSSLQYWIQGMPFSIVGTPSSTVGPVYIYQAATSTGHMISSMNTQGRWYVHPNNGLTSATSTNGHQAGQLGTGQIFATITYRVA